MNTLLSCLHPQGHKLGVMVLILLSLIAEIYLRKISFPKKSYETLSSRGVSRMGFDLKINSEKNGFKPALVVGICFNCLNGMLHINRCRKLLRVFL